MKSSNKIAQQIVDYVEQCGGRYSSWYIGIAADAERRLFVDHCVDRQRDAWVYQECVDSDQARDIEEFFLNEGMQGGPGGGDSYTTSIYAYRTTAYTRE